MKKTKQLQLAQPIHRTCRVSLGKEKEPFIAQPRARQAIDELGRRRLAQQSLSLRLKPTVESLFESNRTKNARGVVLKTLFVQDSDGSVSQMLLPTIAINQLSHMPRIQLDRHGVDREITPIQILGQARRLYGRQLGRYVIG